MIKRDFEILTLERQLRGYPVVAIVGPRQVGKTTLARILSGRAKTPLHYFDLEDPQVLSRFDDEVLVLKDLKGLVVIDEIQRRPEIFPYLRVLADRKPLPARFLILGSASPALLRQSSESLAGRISYHELCGFSMDEVGAKNYQKLWVRGGYPVSYLASSIKASAEWRRNFIKTFLEKDLPQLGITVRSSTLYRFWQMLAHYHAQRWNASEFGRAFGMADTTVRYYLDILTSSFVARQLPPWYENLAKRQVKAPKVYIADSGLLHTLLGIVTESELKSHPKIGASWEGFMIGEAIRRLGARPEECYHWAAHTGAELDLLVARGLKRVGFEIKRTAVPKVTPSMRHAISDLKLSRLDVIYEGSETYPLSKNIRAVGASAILRDLKPL